MGKDSLNNNRQGLGKEAIEDNLQGLGKEAIQDNLQGLSKEAFKDNVQNLGASSFQSNNQTDQGPKAFTDNLQNLQNKGLKDHLEKLPQQKNELSSANFAADSARAVPESPNSQASKPAAPQALPSHLSLISKHEKAMDEFHGRLKGIKQNVDVLNHRLSDFEEEIAKKASDD